MTLHEKEQIVVVEPQINSRGTTTAGVAVEHIPEGYGLPSGETYAVLQCWEGGDADAVYFDPEHVDGVIEALEELRDGGEQ